MNPGYWSLIIISVTFVLLATGWKETIIGNVTNRALFLFFAAWIALSPFNVRLEAARVGVNLSVVLLGFVASVALFRGRTTRSRLQLAEFGLLLAPFFFLFRYLAETNPFLSELLSGPTTAVALGSLTVLATRNGLEQIGCVTIGLLVGHALLLYDRPGYAVLGGPSFRDDWWLAVAAARSETVVLQSVRVAFRGARQSVRLRRKDVRK